MNVRMLSTAAVAVFALLAAEARADSRQFPVPQDSTISWTTDTLQGYWILTSTETLENDLAVAESTQLTLLPDGECQFQSRFTVTFGESGRTPVESAAQGRGRWVLEDAEFTLTPATWYVRKGDVEAVGGDIFEAFLDIRGSSPRRFTMVDASARMIRLEEVLTGDRAEMRVAVGNGAAGLLRSNLQHLLELSGEQREELEEIVTENQQFYREEVLPRAGTAGFRGAYAAFVRLAEAEARAVLEPKQVMVWEDLRETR